MTLSFLRPWRGPRLAVQIVILLLGGLVVAQLVTLLLTVMLPPAPTPQYDLNAVAAALRGGSSSNRLERDVQSGPPDLGGRGWLVSERSRKELAVLLAADPADVRLSFYTPLPFAGTVGIRKLAMANDGPIAPAQPWLRLGSAQATERPAMLILAQMPASPPPPPPNGGVNLPDGRHIPPSAGLPNRDMLPPQALPRGPHRAQREGRPVVERPASAQVGSELIRIDPTPLQGRDGIWIGGDHGETVPPILGGSQPRGTVQQQPSAAAGNGSGASRPASPPIEAIGPNQPAGPGGFGGGPALGGQGFGGQGFGGQGFGGQRNPIPAPFMPSNSLMRTSPYVEHMMTAAPAVELHHTPSPTPHQTPPPLAVPTPVPSQLVPFAAPQLPPQIREQAAALAAEGYSVEPAVPLVPRERGLFGFAPVPFVEGDFVAALRLPDGRWAVVQPADEAFPNSWQRRVALWFLIAFGLVAPIGWLFARRMSKPLAAFAEAAEQLGRDPTAPVLDLDGPAEVGRAAHAFNLMQSRLKSFVGDRTAMIGAISHDLRTPLTRLRFRIEEVDDEAIRDGMIEEVEEMEEMITSVLAFIRDASTPGVRERIDLRTIVEDVAEDAAVVGNDIRLDPMAPGMVDVDVMGMRRLFANLFENAAKYGDRARVRLATDKGEVVVQVIDEGPGVPEEDLERAFEPFYRAANARAGDKRGSGLGLAVCRSIARAHGGDVSLRRSADGFLAELRVPLAYEPADALVG